MLLWMHRQLQRQPVCRGGADVLGRPQLLRRPRVFRFCTAFVSWCHCATTIDSIVFTVYRRGRSNRRSINRTTCTHSLTRTCAFASTRTCTLTSTRTCEWVCTCLERQTRSTTATAATTTTVVFGCCCICGRDRCSKGVSSWHRRRLNIDALHCAD